MVSETERFFYIYEWNSSLTAINPGRSDQNLEFGIISFPVFPAPLFTSTPTTQYKNTPGKNLKTFKNNSDRNLMINFLN